MSFALRAASRLAAPARRGLCPTASQASWLHASAPRSDRDDAAKSVVPAGGMGSRFSLTAEVMVSKLFPAGFGWQAASVVADDMGYKATEIPFFMATGAGDFAGVLAGHTTYYALKKMAIDDSISLSGEVGTATWLATAAFCSGAAWQPIVNYLQDQSVPFDAVFAGVWAGCGTMFFVGLRLGRLVMPWMDGGGVGTDALLSVSIGGATAFFVGTDVAYMDGAGNWLRPVVGIEDADAALVGCVKAGSSTALGFVSAQSLQNLVTPAGQCWVD